MSNKPLRDSKMLLDTNYALPGGAQGLEVIQQLERWNSAR